MRTFFRKRRQPDTLAPEYDAPQPIPAAGTVPFTPPRRHDPLVPEPAGLRMDGPMRRHDDRRMGPVVPERSPTAGSDEEMPRFAFPVSNGMRGALVSGIEPEVSKALREAFTPTRPKKEVNALFIGRLGTIRRIISAIEEERAHVVLYGDRGRGKTSLANAVEQIAVQAGYLPSKLTCSAEMGFEEMFRTLLRRIPAGYHRGDAGQPYVHGRTAGTFDERLPPGPFTVSQLAEVLDEIAGTHVMMVLDEYDRLASEDVKNKLAELIKNMTDKGSPVTLFIIGVAENVDQLLGKHPSIQRALVAVHLPPMSDREIERIILSGSEVAGITFTPESRRIIVNLSKGLPYYAQLLSLHAARGAVARGSREVQRSDMAEAVKRCAEEAERALIEAYHRVIGEGQGRTADVLFLAAQAQSDAFGSFLPEDLLAVPLQPGERHPPADAVASTLDQLTGGNHAVLERVILPGGHRLRFRNQMMRQFVLLMQAERRGIL